ncbi:unnamed protein product [Lactuca virosa]|uniref:Uncharacterized protein n=1 Tax=Lactuca virosa TaxID=75947 RepID=A0AAU9NMA6_9ASTR|nr:unnamed protein product [Lactuca virosa]
MDSPIKVVSTPVQFSTLQERYGFQPKDDLEFPGESASFINPPKSKIAIYVKHFDVGYRLPTSDFFREPIADSDAYRFQEQRERGRGRRGSGLSGDYDDLLEFGEKVWISGEN